MAPTSRYRIQPYTAGSRSARALRDGLRQEGIPALLLNVRRPSRWRAREGDWLVNWGSSSVPGPALHGNVLNWPDVVRRAHDKLEALSTFHDFDVRAPEFTTFQGTAAGWTEEGGTVVCRTVLNGHSGAGIVVATTPDEVVPAPLYTRYVKRTHEFRIHVFGGEVIDTQRKARTYDVPDDEVDWQVRCHRNGFIYARDLDPPDVVKWEAVKAVDCLSLDFGAADVAWHEDRGTVAVFEVNTAPGLEGSTVGAYVDKLKEVMG